MNVDVNCTEIKSVDTINLASRFNKVHLKDLHFSDNYFPSDGGIMLFAEQTKVKGGTVNKLGSPGETMGVATTYHYFDNIFVLKLHEKEELRWARKIAKYQLQLDGSGDASFTGFFENGNIHLFYNKSKSKWNQKTPVIWSPLATFGIKCLKNQ